ncbi:MAG: chemotaxis protein CheD, partial [Desulfobacteraceae bacterium]|nr:chemotaxis protein CheD [Desulfobacteraceae bacterium]
MGVAAFDSQANIGGLCHFLLPSPISHCRVGDEAKYASSGLPFFLDTLLSMGASANKLKVYIAGGAFSGTVSLHDIDLDIGGRTAETVKEILNRKHIHIARSETGGFFTCCLKLNMADGVADIIPSIPDYKISIENVILPTKGQIEAVIDHIQPIPQIALKILRMINEDLSNLGTLATEVKKEQV